MGFYFSKGIGFFKLWDHQVFNWVGGKCIFSILYKNVITRSSHSEVFLEKSVLKICSKVTGEHPYRSAISVKFQNNFIEMTLRHGGIFL